LIEAVVAAAILALALAAFFGAGRNALRVASATNRHTEAALEARSLLDRLGADIPLAAGRFEGHAESGRIYRLIITPLPDAASALAAYDAAVELREHTEDRAPLVRFETLKIAEPAP
jgi:general secretion pathway protein I